MAFRWLYLANNSLELHALACRITCRNKLMICMSVRRGIEYHTLSEIYKAVIIKHYENERYCKFCNKEYCTAEEQLEVFERVRACVTNNHKHWERG